MPSVTQDGVLEWGAYAGHRSGSGWLTGTPGSPLPLRVVKISFSNLLQEQCDGYEVQGREEA